MMPEFFRHQKGRFPKGTESLHWVTYGKRDHAGQPRNKHCIVLYLIVLYAGGVRGCSQSTWKMRGEGGSANIPQLSTRGGRGFRISTWSQCFGFQKQERGSNSCVFFCAAYMTDVVSHQTDEIPEAIYVDGEEQRKWFCDCLLQATLVWCLRINERRTRFLMTIFDFRNPPISEFICCG